MEGEGQICGMGHALIWWQQCQWNRNDRRLDEKFLLVNNVQALYQWFSTNFTNELMGRWLSTWNNSTSYSTVSAWWPTCSLLCEGDEIFVKGELMMHSLWTLEEETYQKTLMVEEKLSWCSYKMGCVKIWLRKGEKARYTNNTRCWIQNTTKESLDFQVALDDKAYKCPWKRSKFI